MRIIGLTGSIGMGKSTALLFFKQKKVPVFDADQYIHLWQNNWQKKMKEILSSNNKDLFVHNKLDRHKLREEVIKNPSLLKKLEEAFHPIIRHYEQKFIKFWRGHRAPLIVLDIPLLYETKAERFCSEVIVVTAPRFIQLLRLEKRLGMTKDFLSLIEKNQWSDYRKRRYADYVVKTSLTKRHTHYQLFYLLKQNYSKKTNRKIYARNCS
ncbi:MAG: dephospho-CoA kinase [Alphaproteobacteria bacterium]|nr:dephospho-CoA kinase [Alphaproteobacteria bacterium]